MGAYVSWRFLSCQGLESSETALRCTAGAPKSFVNGDRQCLSERCPSSGKKVVICLRRLNVTESVYQAVSWTLHLKPSTPEKHLGHFLKGVGRFTNLPISIQIMILVWLFDLYHDYWLYRDFRFNVTIIVISPQKFSFSRNKTFVPCSAIKHFNRN